jgi:hypothetical protein
VWAELTHGEEAARKEAIAAAVRPMFGSELVGLRGRWRTRRLTVSIAVATAAFVARPSPHLSTQLVNLLFHLLDIPAPANMIVL